MEMKTSLPRLSEVFAKDGPRLDELLNDLLVKMLLLSIVVEYLRSSGSLDKETDLEQPAS